MSGAVVFGLFVAGVVVAVTGIVRAANRDATAGVLTLARGVELVLPPHLVGQLAERWRRRESALAWARALVLAPLCGVIAWFIAERFNATTRIAGLPSPLTGPTLLPVAVLGAALLAGALGGGWALARHRRVVLSGGVVAEQPLSVRLRDALPAWLIWGQRVGAVLPAVVALALQLVLRRLGHARGMDWAWTVHVVLLVAGIAGVWVLERMQLAVLNGRCSLGSAQELAFDDLLRVRQAITMAPLAAIALYVAEGFVLRPVFASVPDSVHNLRAIGTAWAVAAVPAALSASWTRRADRFHRRAVAEQGHQFGAAR